MTERSTYPHFPAAETSPLHETSNTATIDEQTPRNDYDPRISKWRRRALVIGGAAATLAATTFLAFNAGASNGREAPRSQPSASAELNPGGVAPELTPSQTAETTEPSPEVVPTDMNSWDVNTFEYDIAGETLTGVTELEAKYGITVKDNPSGEAAAEALIENVNTWINSITTKADNTRYTEYLGRNQLVRSGGIARDIAGDAWGQVLTTDQLDAGETVISPEPWVVMLTGLHVQNIQDAARQRLEGGAEGYRAEYTIQNIDVHAVHKGEAAFTLELTFTAPDLFAEGEVVKEGRIINITANVTMKQVEGANGEMLWKVISWSDEEN